MDDQQEQTSSEEPRSTTPELQVEAKTKLGVTLRKLFKVKSESLPTTEAGVKLAEKLRQQLIEMVDAAAMTEAKRRRASAIDTTDCEAAFDRIVGPRRQQTAISIVADAANAIGSGLIGYGINIYTGTGPDFSKSYLAIGGGGVLVIISIVLKYVTWGK